MSLSSSSYSRRGRKNQKYLTPLSKLKDKILMETQIVKGGSPHLRILIPDLEIESLAI